MPHVLLGLLYLLCIISDLVWPGLAWSANSGRIKGVVQREGKAIANHPMMLIRFGPGQEVNRTPGATDAQGGFVFEGLETGNDLTYVVGIRYEGKLFRSESLQLSDNETKAHVVVQVGEAGTPALGSDGKAAVLRIQHHIMAIVLRAGHLNVREIVNIQNSASTPYRGETPGQSDYVLHLPLPNGYDNLHDIQGVTPEQVRSDSYGLYLTEPLAPGIHRLVYTYALPMTERVRTLLFRRSLPTGVIDVFTDAQHLVATSDFEFLGQVPIESHRFLHFRGINPEPGSRNWVQITRLETHVSRALGMVSYALIVAIALTGLTIPLYNQWQRRGRSSAASAPAFEQIQMWQSERSQLLWAIAQLDNAHASGTLDAPVYRQRRQAYKQQLRRVAEELHQANQPFDTPVLAMHKGQA